MYLVQDYYASEVAAGDKVYRELRFLRGRVCLLARKERLLMCLLARKERLLPYPPFETPIRLLIVTIFDEIVPLLVSSIESKASIAVIAIMTAAFCVYRAFSMAAVSVVTLLDTVDCCEEVAALLRVFMLVKIVVFIVFLTFAILVIFPFELLILLDFVAKAPSIADIADLIFC